MSSRLLCQVDWKIVADVLRDHSATTIFRVKQLLFLDCLTLKMKALWSTKMSVTIKQHKLRSQKNWIFGNKMYYFKLKWSNCDAILYTNRTHLDSEHVMVQPEENHGKETATCSNPGGTILDTGNFQWGMNSIPTPDVWASLWVSGVQQLGICFLRHFQYSWSPLAETVTHQS